MNAIKGILAAAVVCGLFGTAAAQAQFPTPVNTTSSADLRQAAALADEGGALQVKGQYAEALEKYEAALTADPANKKALLGAAWVYNEKGKYEKAKEVATKATKIDFSNAAAYRELGFAEFKLGNLKEARTNLETALFWNPNSKAAMTYLIAVYEKGGDVFEAIQLKSKLADLERPNLGK